MPNTKTKKFDFQVFLAVFLILLVICCATVCVVLSNNEIGVAYASALTYTVESSSGFYLKNISTWSDIESLVNYYFYNVPDLFDSSANVSSALSVGQLTLTYQDSNNTVNTKTVPLNVGYMQSVSDDSVMFTLSTTDNLGGAVVLLLSIGGLSTKSFMLTTTFASPTSTTDTEFYYDITVPTSSTGWTKNFAEYVFGSSNNVSSFTNFSFEFYQDYDLRPILSSTTGNFTSVPTRPDYDNLQSEIDRLNGIITSQRNEIQYYESLNLNQSQIPIFNIARCSPSTFEYNGYTYTSDTIERTSSGWDIYHSSYLNQELPENYGVGFSLFLVETLSNTKFDMSPLIQCWYNYTYDGGAVTTSYYDFSVGYRNQNGQIVKVGSFSSEPGFSDGEFVINAPTNELVFFREESNLMEVDNDFSIVRYQYDTESIYNDGYDAGIRFGMQLGRQEGYNQGVLDANDYSFFSLFTSVFDAPITAIVGKWGDSDGDGVYQREGGMLNFYIPGLDINFAPFLLSLFTIGLIVMIIRFILARKS